MQIILLEKVVNLGGLGDIVKVKDGYARNYLLPQGKALRANEANRKKFEAQRAELEARNLQRKQEAEAVAEKLNGQSFVVIRSAAETGQLYGSVSARDIAEVLDQAGFKVGRSQIVLKAPIKNIGIAEVAIALHAEVTATITLNVARTADEAERQARGEKLDSAEAIYGEDITEASNPEAFFEPGAAEEGEEE